MKNGWAIGSTYSITKCRVFQAAQVKNTRTQAQATHTTLRVLPHRALYACVCVYICMCMHLYDCQLQKGHTINYFHLLEWEFVRNHLKRPCCCCNRVLRATHSALRTRTINKSICKSGKHKLQHNKCAEEKADNEAEEAQEAQEARADKCGKKRHQLKM